MYLVNPISEISNQNGRMMIHIELGIFGLVKVSIGKANIRHILNVLKG